MINGHQFIISYDAICLPLTRFIESAARDSNKTVIFGGNMSH